MLFALKELHPYWWYDVVSERLWLEREKQLASVFGVPSALINYSRPSNLDNAIRAYNIKKYSLGFDPFYWEHK